MFGEQQYHLFFCLVGKVFDGTNRAKWSQEVLEWLVSMASVFLFG